MLGLIHFLFLLMALFFGFRWQILLLELPFDALYRVYVLEILRLAVVVLPFLFVVFRWRRQGFKRQLWSIGLFVLGLYLTYYSVFGPTGFVATVPEVVEADFQRLFDPAKYLMFAVWGYLLLFALWVNRERLPNSVDGWDE